MVKFKEMKKILKNKYLLATFLLLAIFLVNPVNISAQSVCKSNQTDLGCGGTGGGQQCGNTYRMCLDASTGTPDCLSDPSCAGGTNSGSSAISGHCGTGFVDTAIGCIPISSSNGLIGFLLNWGIGIGGGIAFILILIAGFQIITSRGDPKRLQAGQELLTSAIAGLVMLIFSVFILRIIGVTVF